MLTLFGKISTSQGGSGWKGRNRVTKGHFVVVIIVVCRYSLMFEFDLPVQCVRDQSFITYDYCSHISTLKLWLCVLTVNYGWFSFCSQSNLVNFLSIQDV